MKTSRSRTAAVVDRRPGVQRPVVAVAVTGVVAALASAMLSGVVPGSAAAEVRTSVRAAAVPTFIVTRAGVAYRTGPGTNYRQLGTLRQGGILAGTGRTSGGWRQFFTSNGGSAWVLSAYLAGRAFPVYKVIARDGVNLRSGPGTNYRLQGTLRYGVVVPSTGRQSQGWIQLQLSTGGIYWASGRYLALIGPKGVAAAPGAGPLDPVHHHSGKVCRTAVPPAPAC